MYWSRSFYERQRHENRSFLDFVFIALTMMRLIQRKARAALPGDKAKKDVKWSYGIPGARIARALREKPHNYWVKWTFSKNEVANLGYIIMPRAPRRRGIW